MNLNQQPAEKKGFKKWASQKTFGPSYFVRSLAKFIYSEKAKSSPYFCPMEHQSKVRGRLRKILCPSQNIWTLPTWSNTVSILRKFSCFLPIVHLPPLNIVRRVQSTWILISKRISALLLNSWWRWRYLFSFDDKMSHVSVV